MADHASTDMLFLRDAYLQDFTATVTAVRHDSEDAENGSLVALDQTAFYATSGGQPHDTGTVAGRLVTAVKAERSPEGTIIWHQLGESDPSSSEGSPSETLSVGDQVTCSVNWERRHQLMRTHTALHILCGVIWNEWGVSVTGGNMEPLKARMDFEFDPLPDGFADRITELVNAEIAHDHPIEVSFLPRSEALADSDLIRTKVNLIPESVTEIRVVDIVGLDKQADGGTHVASTGEVGVFSVVKTESKGKGNKRVRIELH